MTTIVESVVVISCLGLILIALIYSIKNKK
jgi:type II secretory pathway pseudopilin PulG